MPANLPPEYFEAEKRYKEAESFSEKISSLEALIATVPKHKGTDKLRADLRRRLSKLRDDATKRKKSGKGDLYAVEREGAAQVGLVGFPNSGKSSLLAGLTHAHPVIADYPMSTVMPLSGMMRFEDIQYQIVDLPPIGNRSTDGWVSGILRNTDAFLLVLDLSEDPDIQAELLLDQIDQWKIRILKKGEIIEGNEEKNIKKVIMAGNKLDLGEADKSFEILRTKYESEYPLIAVSSKSKEGIEDLRHTVFKVSGIIRIYSKEPGKEPDLNVPFTLPSGSTLLDLAASIHKDFLENLKYACVWGSSKFPGQKVHKDHILQDKDIVEFHV
jgi:ribosome-interacting GTPase 1